MSYIALDGALAQLTGAVGIGATSIPVTTGKGALFEVGSNHSYVTFESATETETVKITGRSTDSLTVLPTTKAWNIGDIIECRPCAQAMADYAVGPQIDTAAAKATPVGADKMGILDSAASMVLKYVTWANIKATLFGSANTFTGAQKVQAAATQDAIELAGRAGGTSSYKVTHTPTTLTASRTVTDQDKSGTNALLEGTTTNDNAAAGQVGEYVESVYSNVSSPSSNTWGDAGTAITLTSGDWDICITGFWALNGATMTLCRIGMGTVTGNDSTGIVTGDTYAVGFPPSASVDVTLTIPNKRVSLSGSTNYYLKTNSTYSAGTPKFWGRISARRVR